MTYELLEEHYNKNLHKYQSLMSCSCVSELLLRIAIYGETWSQWDWLLLLIASARDLEELPNNDDSVLPDSFYKDLLVKIDTTNELDSLFTNKDLLLGLIWHVKTKTNWSSRISSLRICNILAHTFKKFPKLWTMSWMFANCKDTSRKRWIRYHRLHSFLRLPAESRMYSYAHPKECYDIFLDLYFEKNLQ